MGTISLVCFIILIVFVLIGVAFLTLLERKVLGYIQIRNRPNNVDLLYYLYNSISSTFC